MSQDNPQISTTPPLPGLQLVQDLNKALQTLATDFSGATDPAAMAWPYSTWADTGTGTLKRRNAANSAWVIEGRLLRAHLPMYALADVPTLDIGPIYIIGRGPAEWLVSEYKALIPDVPSASDLQWLGMPVGVPLPIYYSTAPLPPTDDSRFRYVLLSAGSSYNDGVLVDETVSGTAPRIAATAKVSLAGSLFDGLTIRLNNTERRFIGASESQGLEDDMLQGHWHALYKSSTSGVSFGSGTFLPRESTAGAGDAAFSPTFVREPVSDGTNGTPRTGNRTQPYTLRLPHIMRII